MKAAGQDVDENKATVAVEDAKAADKAARKQERHRSEQARMEQEYRKAEKILQERSPNPVAAVTQVTHRLNARERAERLMEALMFV